MIHCLVPCLFAVCVKSVTCCTLNAHACLALQILDSLIAEDDSVPNVWYMLAMCLLGGGEIEAAEEALQQGQLLLKKSADADDLVKEFSELKVWLAVLPMSMFPVLGWCFVQQELQTIQNAADTVLCGAQNKPVWMEVICVSRT